jgi:hypothetical protein
MSWSSVKNNWPSAVAPDTRSNLPSWSSHWAWLERASQTLPIWHEYVLCFFQHQSSFSHNAIHTVCVISGKGLLQPSRIEFRSFYIKLQSFGLTIPSCCFPWTPSVSLVTVVAPVTGGTLSTGGVTHPHWEQLLREQAWAWPLQTLLSSWVNL